MAAYKGRHRLQIGPSVLKGVPPQYEGCAVRVVFAHEEGKIYGEADAEARGREAHLPPVSFSCRIYPGKVRAGAGAAAECVPGALRGAALG